VRELRVLLIGPVRQEVLSVFPIQTISILYVGTSRHFLTLQLSALTMKMLLGCSTRAAAQECRVHISIF
jgi:hypothetical protein